MLNKVSLTGLVQNVNLEDNSVDFLIPDANAPQLTLNMCFEEKIVKGIKDCFDKGDTLISIEGQIEINNQKQLDIYPISVQAVLLSKNTNPASA